MTSFFEGVAGVWLIPLWILAAIGYRRDAGRWKIISIFWYARQVLKSEYRNLLLCAAGLFWWLVVVAVIVVRLLTK